MPTIDLLIKVASTIRVPSGGPTIRKGQYIKPNAAMMRAIQSAKADMAYAAAVSQMGGWWKSQKISGKTVWEYVGPRFSGYGALNV